MDIQRNLKDIPIPEFPPKFSAYPREILMNPKLYLYCSSHSHPHF